MSDTMKTDRELLELAARAAGVDWFDEPAAVAGIGLHMKSGPFWNPLTDDGDAFRLASKLGLCVIFHAVHVEYSKGNGEVGHIAEHSFRDTASTRRAIVRAAAEIGKEMK